MAPVEVQGGAVDVGRVGKSSGGSIEGVGENSWGSQEEEGDGRAAVDGPGSSEDRNRVVEDWESKVLASDSATEKGDRSVTQAVVLTSTH